MTCHKTINGKMNEKMNEKGKADSFPVDVESGFDVEGIERGRRMWHGRLFQLLNALKSDAQEVLS